MGFVFGPLYGILIYLYITHLFLNGAPFTSDEDLNPQEQDSPPKSCKNINYLTQRDLTESGDYNYLLVYLNVTLMSKETSHYIGAGIGGSVGLGLTLASPWSPTTRCSSLLMIPSLLTKRGRDFMLTFVTGLVLTGPVNTFQYNFQEIVRSFTCMYCQVKDLAGTTSIRNIIDRMRKTFADVMFLIKLIGKWWSKLLYMSVIYVIIDALDYQRGYYIDDDFDNMMVDDNLRRKWKVEGEARLTPMRNWELKDRYQKTTSLWISKTERRKMIKQSFPTIIVTIIVVAIVIGDWVLTAILTTLAKTAGTLTSKVCLPRGLKTPSEAYGVIFTMLFVCLLSCAIDAYSTRIRPLVCHIFFPERAKERANYLYKYVQGVPKKEGFTTCNSSSKSHFFGGTPCIIHHIYSLIR